MIVTDKEYYLENKLIEKLDLIVKRLKGSDDAVIIIDGDEGVGKTNLSVALCYYIAFKTKRKYGIENIFFDLDELITYASQTEGKIIHWDEGALGGMSIQWWKENQIKFVQLLMIARKKKHFITICIPKFHKLQEYLIVDRSIALLHAYARRNLEKGRFFYFTKKKKESLFNYWKRSHKKNYIMFKSFAGTFPKAMNYVFSPEEIVEYDNKKDKAIMGLSKEKIDKKSIDLIKLKYKVASVQGITQEKLAEILGIERKTLYLWRKEGEENLIQAPVL